MTEGTRVPIPIFEQRRIDAMILKHVYDTRKAGHGVEVAQKTIANAVRASSIEQAREFEAKVGGKASIQTSLDRQSLWKLGGAMEIEVKQQTATRAMRRCSATWGLRSGRLLSCQRNSRVTISACG
jgi:hypothetical protein